MESRFIHPSRKGTQSHKKTSQYLQNAPEEQSPEEQSSAASYMSNKKRENQCQKNSHLLLLQCTTNLLLNAPLTTFSP
jgi:hypothetical protein